MLCYDINAFLVCCVLVDMPCKLDVRHVQTHTVKKDVCEKRQEKNEIMKSP